MHGQHEMVIMYLYIECKYNRLIPANLEPQATKEDSILTTVRHSHSSKYFNREGAFRYRKEESEFVSQVYTIVRCPDKSGHTVHHYQAGGRVSTQVH